VSQVWVQIRRSGRMGHTAERRRQLPRRQDQFALRSGTVSGPDARRQFPGRSRRQERRCTPRRQPHQTPGVIHQRPGHQAGAGPEFLG